MQSGEQSRPYEVRGPLQAAVFENPLCIRLLMACVPEERSLSQLHQQLGVSISKLHYHARKLLACNLLFVSRMHSRAGRPIKFYRAVGGSFLVSQDTLRGLPGDRWSMRLREALKNDRNRSGDHALLYSAATDGKVLAKTVLLEPTTSARSLELWRIVRLNAAQRAALAVELTALVERFAAPELNGSGEPFLVHAAFAPR